jgi:hypothetical protein
LQVFYHRRYLIYDLMAVDEQYVGRFPHLEGGGTRQDFEVAAKMFKVGWWRV